MGIDDYLAAGGTVAELKALARQFERQDLTRVRLSRDAKLKARVEELERTFWAFDWKGMGGHSTRDAYKVAAEAAAACGTLQGEEWVRVALSWRTWQERASIGSSRTLGKAIARMEEWGLGYRDNEGRERGKPGVFVLRASVKQLEGQSSAREEKESKPRGVSNHSALHLRAPRLRWSDPGQKARRGLVKDTRRVRDARQPARPARKRLGKIRCAVIDALESFGVWGCELPLGELYDILNPGKCREKRRPRDLRRRQLPMLEEAGIITVDEDLVVGLTDDWREALENARELGGDLKAEELAHERHARQRMAYHHGDKIKCDEHYVNACADGRLEDLKPASEAPPEEPVVSDEVPVSPLARALGEYLEKNPRDACQRAVWLGSTLWAFELVEGKPSPEEVLAALEALGGDAYRRELLKRPPLAAR